jgi:RNA polymerase sigma-B factor
MPDTAIAPSPPALPLGRPRRALEEARLFERYRRTRDSDTRTELVTRYLPLAKRLAGRYQSGAEYEDLVQVASFALLKAIDRYDPGRGLAFSSYAVPTIVGELKRYFRDHTWTVRVPRELHDRVLEVRRASEALAATLGRSPTPAELAEALESTVEHVLEALQTASAYRPDRLDAPVDADDDDGGRPLAVCEERGFANAEASAALKPLLARLEPRERTILRLRFEDDLTQSEIGALLGISQMHVSRCLRASIATLQRLAADTAEPPLCCHCTGDSEGGASCCGGRAFGSCGRSPGRPGPVVAR